MHSKWIAEKLESSFESQLKRFRVTCKTNEIPLKLGCIQILPPAALQSFFRKKVLRHHLLGEHHLDRGLFLSDGLVGHRSGQHHRNSGSGTEHTDHFTLTSKAIFFIR